jgi:hypothetical protein
MAVWNWSEELWATVNGLHTLFQQLEGGAMKQKALTPESLRKLGEGMREQILATLSPKEILAQVPDDGGGDKPGGGGGKRAGDGARFNIVRAFQLARVEVCR